MIEAAVTESNEPELIFSYSRAEAIADGVLIDVTAPAAEAGFKFPVAITARIHADINEFLRKSRSGIADYSSILYQILTMLRIKIELGKRFKREAGDTLFFDVRASARSTWHLKSIVGPGDAGEGGYYHYVS